jgi:hypothetical protein
MSRQGCTLTDICIPCTSTNSIADVLAALTVINIVPNTYLITVLSFYVHPLFVMDVIKRIFVEWTNTIIGPLLPIVSIEQFFPHPGRY